MLPLIRMAWTLNRRTALVCAPALALILAAAVLKLAQGDATKFMTSCLFSGSLLGGLVAFQGLASDTEGFLLALPVSRAQVVRARYLTSLVAVALGLALPLGACAVAHLAAPARVPALGAETVALAGVLALVLGAGLGAFLPFVYRFGTPKGPIVFMALLGLTCLVLAPFTTADDVLDAFVRLLNRVVEERAFGAAAAAAVAVFLGLSLTYATWAYGRREGR